jgi:hypothetical protein
MKLTHKNSHVTERMRYPRVKSGVKALQDFVYFTFGIYGNGVNRLTEMQNWPTPATRMFTV